MSQADAPDTGLLPRGAGPIEQVTRPFVRFMAVESASGIVLAIGTLVALVAVNSGRAVPIRVGA